MLKESLNVYDPHTMFKLLFSSMKLWKIITIIFANNYIKLFLRIIQTVLIFNKKKPRIIKICTYK